ncbi:acetolactate synthase small subunit [Candidatus Margulisiibacteriota bacterium]
MKHTLSVLVENKPGVLQKAASLFSRRGFNIESLAVGTTEDESISRMTIVVAGDDKVLEQITKQLYKLIDVIRVFDIPKDNIIDRELILLRVNAPTSTRKELTELIDMYKGHIVDVAEDSIIIEITGDSEKVEGFKKLLEKFGIKELVRTGKIALQRGTE